MQRTTPGSWSTSFRQGILIGLILGIIQAILSLISSFFTQASIATVFFVIFVVLTPLGCLYAGLRASQRTGLISTGLLAGMWAGFISSLISFLYALIVTIITIDSIRARAQSIVDKQHLNIHYTNSMLISGVIVYDFGLIVVATLVGLGVGTIGGAIGRRNASVPVATYEESMFQPPPSNPTSTQP